MVATKLDGYRCYFDTVIRLLDKVVSHKLPRRFQSTRKILDSTSHYVMLISRHDKKPLFGCDSSYWNVVALSWFGGL